MNTSIASSMFFRFHRFKSFSHTQDLFFNEPTSVVRPVVTLDLIDTMFKYIHTVISQPCSNITTCDQVIAYVTTRDHTGASQRWGPISTAASLAQLRADPNYIQCEYRNRAFTCTIQFLAPVDGYIESVELVVRLLGNTVNALEYTHVFGTSLPISKGITYNISISFRR